MWNFDSVGKRRKYILTTLGVNNVYYQKKKTYTVVVYQLLKTYFSTQILATLFRQILSIVDEIVSNCLCREFGVKKSISAYLRSATTFHVL